MAKPGFSITYYEVYVLERDRWSLQMRYRREEKDYAMSEAKGLERTLNTKTKVVRETYYPETNTSDEMTIYVTPRQPVTESVALPGEILPPSPPPHKRSDTDKAVGRTRYEPPKPFKPPRKSYGFALAFKVVAIVVAGIVVAIFAAGIISTALAQLGRWGVYVAPKDYSMVLFAIFAGTFLLTAIPLALIFINNAEDIEALTGWKSAPSSRPAARPARRSDTGMRMPPPSAAGDRPRPAPAYAPPPDYRVAPVQAQPAAVVAAEPFEDAALPEELPSQPALKPQPASTLPAAAERQRVTILQFLNGAVATLKQERPHLDRYNTFGLDLMLAGGIEMLGERHGIDPEAHLALLREAMAILGTKPAAADAFCDQYEQYLREPRYLQMVQAGREAMAGFLADVGDPYVAMKAALDRWNRPAGPAANARIITVIFTDMVGSTILTQTLGEMAAQDALRRHNTIVRSALTEFDGKEIKHTGDGIMASFGSASSAVDAAIAIQKAVGHHNAANPDLPPLHLRIGMNTGEPIEEEDDLFGTTVQMAARACAMADPDAILCTNVVRELNAGRNRRFIVKGDFALKGFREAIPLYEIVAGNAAEG